MKVRQWWSALAVALVTVVLVACGSKLTMANLEKVHNDMTVAEVKAVLGEPSEEQSGGMGPLSGTTLVYKSGKNEVTINFMNGKVVAKSGSFEN